MRGIWQVCLDQGKQGKMGKGSGTKGPSWKWGSWWFPHHEVRLMRTPIGGGGENELCITGREGSPGEGRICHDPRHISDPVPPGLSEIPYPPFILLTVICPRQDNNLQLGKENTDLECALLKSCPNGSQKRGAAAYFTVGVFLWKTNVSICLSFLSNSSVLKRGHRCSAPWWDFVCAVTNKACLIIRVWS